MNSPKKRIAHIIKVKGVSGAENHLLTLLPELLDDFDIHLIMLVGKENPMPAFATEFEKKIGKVTRLQIKNHYDFSIIPKLYGCFKIVHPDIVHTHLIHADLHGLVAAKLAGVKVVVSSKHGYDNYENTSIFYRLNGVLSGFLNQVITISHALQAKVEREEGIPRSKMKTIHYGLDGGRYADRQDRDFARSFFSVKVKTCLIGSVGRLIPVKGYETLLKAVSGIDLDFRLLILGDGPLKGDLESMVKENNLSERVKFIGFYPDVSRILSGIDLFVLPTLGEGFGLVLLEAMAHRLPIVATDTMAIPEIVENENTGILVPPKDALSLRRAIEELIESSDNRVTMGNRGWERLIERFSVDKMVSSTKKLYHELLEHY